MVSPKLSPEVRLTRQLDALMAWNRKQADEIIRLETIIRAIERECLTPGVVKHASQKLAELG